MAQASGLALLGARRRDPLGATSYGTGQLIAAAVRAGARRVVVGLGGSATNDGGAGMAQALGARLLDSRGRELAPGASELLRLSRIEWGGRRELLKDVRVIGVSDVTNPLTGPKGSARVFGPQKGASPAQVRVLERALRRYAACLRRDLGRDVAALPGAGAAGGLGAGLLAFLSAKLVPGADWVLRELEADGFLRRADIVLTGEGRLDETSFFGKAPVALARRAKAFDVPVAVVCGARSPGLGRRLRGCGIKRVVDFGEAGAGAADSRKRASRWARRAAALAVQGLLCCGLLLMTPAGGAAAQPSSVLDEVDRLYFHRHEGLNLEDSIERLEALMGQSPGDPALLWRLGRSLVRLGERKEKKKEKLALFEKAEGLERRAVAAASEDPEPHYWLGIAMGRRGQTRGMLKSLFIVGDLKKEMGLVLALQPNHGGAHHVLGEMFMELPGFAGGDKKKALEELETAARLEPDETSHYVPLARAHLAVGDKEKAVATLKKALEVERPADPAEYERDLAAARRLLSELEK
jgi:glycerate kinase